MDLASAPAANVEYLALDTETNGLGGDLCELTEVGAALVGGGEVHESWDSLVRVERPLSRGIERFTGITQGMVDAAPPPEEVLPEVAPESVRLGVQGQVLGARQRVLEQLHARDATPRTGRIEFGLA